MSSEKIRLMSEEYAGKLNLPEGLKITVARAFADGYRKSLEDNRKQMSALKGNIARNNASRKKADTRKNFNRIERI